MKNVSRREFLGASLAGAAALSMSGRALAADDIRVGSLLDTSGPFDAYGKPMDFAADMAIAEINDSGGINGRQVVKVGYDTQSDVALYGQFAQKLARADNVDVVHGGILSSSREAIRPIFRRGNIPYFYNVLYEGGVCDRNFFCTGVTPAQQVEALIPHAVEKWGKRIYVLAADYNYGQITANWVSHYAREAGAEVVQTDFFPLDFSGFGPTITKIQEADPDMVVSVLVGGSHLSFYRQWAGIGMKENIPMASTTMGAANEHVVLRPDEGDGMLVAYNYAKSSDSPVNQAFLKKWAARGGDVNLIHEIAVSHYQGLHLWANAAREAGGPGRDGLLRVLEGGFGIEGPGGRVTMDAKTHHAALDIHIMEVKNQEMRVLESSPQRPPADTQRVCDLGANPEDTRQYEIQV